ncbi:MAG: 2-isopropylmalate synthase [Coriobacteriales bacterium]|jgi:2-isopropylmalate synthase|nr:2-isopropylmalate synthase [Coriobacteriales bacterium]
MSTQSNIRIFDTTLRDGEQAPGCSMNLAEKIEVARQLEALKVDVMEAGFAISSPGDFESVQTIANTVKDSYVCSLSRALEKDIDASAEALKGAKLPYIHVFLATSEIHMQHKLRMTPEQVLERTSAMVKYARNYCDEVQFSAEDATRSDRPFLAQVCAAAIQAGARTINIPDTVGYTTPAEMTDLLAWLQANVENADKAVFSVHCHNDLGMAVANSLAGALGGARQIECTVNGIGERAGNAALEEVVMALKVRRDLFGADSRIETTQIARSSRLIYQIIGQGVPLNKAIVGKNAFAHESGIHQHGVLAEKTTYEIMTPESVGVRVNAMVLGKHSGRHAFESRLAELGYALEPAELDAAFAAFKVIADRKKEISDADLEAIVSHRPQVLSPVEPSAQRYELEGFHVHSGKDVTAVCVMRLAHGDEVHEEVSLGDGPVDAAYNAVDKIMGTSEAVLESYNIQATSDGKDALGEVVVKLRAGEQIRTGRGLSTDIIESSILAYLNAANQIAAS